MPRGDLRLFVNVHLFDKHILQSKGVIHEKLFGLKTLGQST